MASDVAFEKHERLLHSIAWKISRRLRSKGVMTVQQEDIFQELAVAWCKARDRWLPEYNVPFTAFAVNGMNDHIKSLIRSEEGYNRLAPVSLDMDIREDSDGSSGELIDRIEDPTAVNPEADAEASSHYKALAAKMSDGARKVVEILLNPPDSVMQLVKAMQERSLFARSRNIRSFSPTDLKLATIFNILDVPRVERGRIYKELKLIMEDPDQSVVTKMKPIMKPELAPGCFGMGLTYDANAPDCQTCPFVEACGPIATDTLASIRQELGVAERPKRAKRQNIIPTPASPTKPRLTSSSTIVADYIRRIEALGISVTDSLSKGENPFVDKPAFLRVVCALLLKFPSINRMELQMTYERRLNISTAEAQRYARFAFLTLIEIGAVDEIDGRIKIRQNKEAV